MNSATRHKLFHTEVTPPPGAWEKITAALDDAALSSKFPSALYNLEITPPARNWEQISASLDQQPAYAVKLAGMAVPPPPTTWSTIEASLDTPVTRKRKIPVLARYAAAALLTGILALAGYRLFNGKTGQQELAALPANTTEESVHAAHLQNILDEGLAVSNLTASLEEARNDAALEASKKTFARLDVSEKKSRIKSVRPSLFITDEYEPVSTRGLGAISEEICPPSFADRYILLMTPEGKMIRMSKKLGGLVCCVSGEDQDKDCIDQLKKWRDKMAHPSQARSSGNILDILSLLETADND